MDFGGRVNMHNGGMVLSVLLNLIVHTIKQYLMACIFYPSYCMGSLIMRQ